jgi:cyclase
MGKIAMLRNRVIPVLLVKDHGLVKTTMFKNPQYVGDPINAIRIFNEKEVDELVILDISATAANRGPNFNLVKDVASECFMPLAYGGGVRNLDDAKQLFHLGVEKVIVRSAAMTDLAVITQIASFSGSSSLAVSIDLKKARFGSHRIFAPNTPRHGESNWIDFMQQAIGAGAGEIILNSVDRDGTMTGMDVDLIKVASKSTSVPLVAVGGIGSLEHIQEAIRCGADAVGGGAFFVYHGPRKAVLITYPTYEQLSSLLGDL